MIEFRSLSKDDNEAELIALLSKNQEEVKKVPAEQLAIKEGSSLITIPTQDHQAKTFYEKFGYHDFGKLDNTPFIGTTNHHLVKRIEHEKN
ncbi:hypothetical protein ATZ33_07710 [Enterococcus silesiacus]|uniref:N-acetyltransferase domain-containing protein n=1 Tax=Enterococcus silesiacus TaxID=332949 RepID=A0A0S3KAD9_9ENTE|nr:hypothetical protein [Enterococcus silesiacus]ALS01259.1 hypothetical protein ATZ33_07710 [Enterococcus silesiacus]OJG92658.1 hypothetical protein RV15_GL003083 [Enterococcus silesiacus]